MTSEDEKTVHQQSITTVEQALEVAGNFGSAATVVLAAEVRRLQASLQGRYEDIGVIQTSERSAYKIAHEAVDANSGLRIEVDRLRETIRVMSTNEGKLHAKIAELETERARLRRIEAVHTCGGGPTPCGGCCECLERTYPEPHEHQRMSAKLARVEALPDRWKGRIMPPDDRWVHAALELEAALRD